MEEECSFFLKEEEGLGIVRNLGGKEMFMRKI